MKSVFHCQSCDFPPSLSCLFTKYLPALCMCVTLFDHLSLCGYLVLLRMSVIHQTVFPSLRVSKNGKKLFFCTFRKTVWHFRAGSIDEREKAAIGLQFLSQSAFSWGNYVVLLYVKDWIRLCFFSPSPSLAIRETWMEKSDCFPSSSGVSCNQVCTWIQGKLPHLCCYFIIKVSTHQ